MSKLAGQTILITGAGRGLGHGVARGLAAHGAHVVAAARTASELQELETTITAAGGAITTYQVDLADESAVNHLASLALERFGTINTLINNAAVLRMRSFLELPPHEFDATIAINLLAPVQLCRALLPSMIDAGRGSILNVTSAAGIRGFVDETDYCASKFGLEGFTYALALECQPLNISVNLVSPGYRIKPTSVTAAEFESWPEERRAEFHDPLSMADAFAWLATQDGSGTTGQRFNAWELAERVRTVEWV